MSDNDQVQGSWHGDIWVSAAEKRSHGFNNNDQIYGCQSKMDAHFGINNPYLQQSESRAPIGHVDFNPKLFFTLIGIAIVAIYLALNGIFGSKTPKPTTSAAVNQITEGSVTRSLYVQNIPLANGPKLGTRKDGSIKSESEIIQDYKNVLTGVLPQSELNSLISEINPGKKDYQYLMRDIQNLRWKAERYKKEALYDEQLAKYFLNNLYYDPAKPELTYNFKYYPINSQECDINNVCVKGERYRNMNYSQGVKSLRFY